MKLNYTSHIGQDAWVAECLQFKKAGYFLDFGAFDGKTINNTYVLEKQLGWSGICVEPNPKYYMSLCNCRRSVTVNVALWPISRQQVRFVDAHGLSSLEAYIESDSLAEIRKRPINPIIEVDTLNPTELLNRFDVPNAIDYLSLDVEGCEYEILTALDISTYSIALMTIEHNHNINSQKKIRDHLTAYGYDYVENRNEDWFFHLGHLNNCLNGKIANDPKRIFEIIYASTKINDPF